MCKLNSNRQNPTLINIPLAVTLFSPQNILQASLPLSLCVKGGMPHFFYTSTASPYVYNACIVVASSFFIFFLFFFLKKNFLLFCTSRT